MARPERNNVDYFPFYCEEGNKMFYIEETYGNDGFATFIKILRELAKSNYHYLDLSKPTTQMFLSAKCKVSKEILLAIISDLVELGKFDKVLWTENSVVWCQDFTDSIRDAYDKRKNKCITYDGLLLHLSSLGVRKPVLKAKNNTHNTQTILKETIVYETKEDNSVFNFKKSLIDFGFKSNLVDDWLKVRKQKKATNTETALNSFLKEVEKSKKDKNEILETCIERDWKVFKVEWLNKEPQKKSTYIPHR